CSEKGDCASGSKSDVEAASAGSAAVPQLVRGIRKEKTGRSGLSMLSCESEGRATRKTRKGGVLRFLVSADAAIPSAVARLPGTQRYFLPFASHEVRNLAMPAREIRPLVPRRI